MDQSINLEGTIQGWGADLDPKNRPAYPMEKTPEHGTGAHWDVPPQQIAKVKIHKSVERPAFSHVMGTTCPPRGLSGLIRTFAYRYGEARFAHWLILLFADRVDVVESIVTDLFRGRVPNIFEEMGLKSELKYNRENFQKKLMVTGASILAAGVAFYWLKNRSSKRPDWSGLPEVKNYR